jgi:hypothetical protein
MIIDNRAVIVVFENGASLQKFKERKDIDDL